MRLHCKCNSLFFRLMVCMYPIRLQFLYDHTTTTSSNSLFIFCYQYGTQCKNAVSDGFNSVDGHFLTCNVCFANHIDIYHDKTQYISKIKK